MSAPVIEAVLGRSLVDALFFGRLSRRVARNHGLDMTRAEEITDQALAYLATAARKPAGAPTLYMSAAVDPAWHEFMHDTFEYDRFFERHGWPKVHHQPCDGGPDGARVYPPGTEALPPTVAAIEAAGYRVEPGLWTAGTDCGDTCGDDGVPGNPPDCGHGV
ncbi:hypothetical protein [Streptomyces sp. SUK 48]|uniref:hypothetical protein n=1 Tax=Streptomyces sp. SUK 48 TaxID=2582831 RepID=UPI00129A36F0|nr:hypothetical protein [Streptomyces sp. SUK 48]